MKIWIPGPHNQTVRTLLTKFGSHTFTNDEKPDLVVLTGGGDINSRLYFEAPNVRNSYPQNARDLEEIQAIFIARSHQIPIVGICRGAQLIHVMNGGRLEQHIEGHKQTKHRITKVCDYMDSVRSKFIGKFDGIETNSLHHQAIPLLEAQTNYEFTMKSKGDNLVEATEVYFDRGMKVGAVQYHPEYATASSESVQLFKDMIEMLVA